MPLYGYAYQGVNTQNNGQYSTYTSAKSVSYKMLKKSYLDNTDYRQFRHEEAQPRHSWPGLWVWAAWGSGRSPRTMGES